MPAEAWTTRRAGPARTRAACAVVIAGAVLLSGSLAGCTSDDGASSGSAPTAPAPAGAASAASSSVPSSYWAPSPGASWQWQLSGSLDLDVDADIFDVDYETTTVEQTAALKAKGRHLVCYLSVGSREDFRPDAGNFPDTVRGKTMDGWPDEQWLDIRQTDVLLPIMAARMDTCAAKGFDAVEPDNVDGYRNDTGFPLTAEDQLAYNRAVAGLAHDRGLSVALKNDLDQIPALVDHFDFSVNEECVRYAECGAYQPFTDAGKAVLHVEYEGTLSFCPGSRQRGFSSMLKPLDLGAPRQPC
ncbi:endo alpha-1,4 polygalactosaminidase [Arthrobacter sp. zg-Y20]|uniref:endo alpha-1,4 polygalactosaminidase n=1 Tax=unclassified Arthrobacter TaxID=235627 RepID=UPI001D15B5E4|nr:MULTISPECIES: endo alpha-1,4 polygalactosaminidase [unclassified Arthrobacter]MCC3274510.1 endo alpha-1,4 polygalactosaminidase [Arthrobacter sp. zg-Y20]MDK1314667.1 endo alpha-1,4 polygalactosaminidase [Arthrobacter sp. zg.Y20]WIB07648.1 endo alpha-1,4 polygalactosaminidase [Arthrobacter sp. zg-Y20]